MVDEVDKGLLASITLDLGQHVEVGLGQLSLAIQPLDRAPAVHGVHDLQNSVSEEDLQRTGVLVTGSHRTLAVRHDGHPGWPHVHGVQHFGGESHSHHQALQFTAGRSHPRLRSNS